MNYEAYLRPVSPEDRLFMINQLMRESVPQILPEHERCVLTALHAAWARTIFG